MKDIIEEIRMSRFTPLMNYLLVIFDNMVINKKIDRKEHKKYLFYYKNEIIFEYELLDNSNFFNGCLDIRNKFFKQISNDIFDVEHYDEDIYNEIIKTFNELRNHQKIKDLKIIHII